MQASRLFAHGQQLAAQERIEEALQAFAHALTLRPRIAGIYLHQALALAEASQLSEAVAALQQAMALQPRNPVLPMFLGQILFDAADYTGARAWCDRAVRLNPHNPHAQALQALTDLACGNIAQAYHHLQQPVPIPMSCLERGALRLVGGGIPSLLRQTNAALQCRLLLWCETYLLQHPGEARTLAQQLIAQTAAPRTRTTRALTQIDRLLTHGILGLRRLCARLRYAGQPTAHATGLLYLQAEEALYLGDLGRAEQLYTQYLQHAPDHLHVHEQLLEVTYEQGKFPQALAHLRRVLAQSPADQAPSPAQSVLLGELLYEAGHAQEAIAALTPAVTRAKHDYKAFYYLGLGQLCARAPQAARRSFARAVSQLNPDIAALRLDEVYRVHRATLCP